MKNANCTEKPTRLPARVSLSRCILCLTLAFSGHSLSQTSSGSAQSQRDMALLADAQHPASVVWLEDNSGRFLALYEQDRSGNPVGAVLVLNAEGQHSSWPITSEKVRLSFPEFGWNTLSTQLPDPKPNSVPERPKAAPASNSAPEEDTDSGDQQENPQEGSETPEEPTAVDTTETDPDSDTETDTETTATPIIDPETLSLQRIQKAIEFLHKNGQFNIVLMGQGIGALRAACALPQLPENSSQQSRLIRALVLVDAQNQLPADSSPLSECLSKPGIPVLDVFRGYEQSTTQQAKERKTAAKRARYTTYVQIQLPPVARNDMLGENRLSRRIRGFMAKHARGVKVDNAVIKSGP